MLREKEVRYSLLCAVREGRLEKAQELINTFGLSFSKDWSDGYVLLCEALSNRQVAVAELLLTSGCRVNKKNSNPSFTALHSAVMMGDMEIIRMLLNKGAYIEARDKLGRTPLYCVVQSGKIEVIELLLKCEADIDAADFDHRTPIGAAVEAGKLQIVELLLEYGAHVRSVYISTREKLYTSLYFAVEKGMQEITSLLLSKGANVDSKLDDDETALHAAAKAGYVCIAEDLLNHGACIHSLTLKDGYTPLHFASKLCSEETVKLFLTRGADINARTKDNLTPLHIATQAKSKAVMKLLLQHGAIVDIKDKNNKTVLYLAVETSCLTIVEDVLKYCPDIDHPSNRSSLNIAVLSREFPNRIVKALQDYGLVVNPENANSLDVLSTACEKGYLKIVEDLVKYGADVNMIQNSVLKEGFTPLHSAVNNKQEKIVKLLINSGANINAQDEPGKTPIFYAIDNSDSKIFKHLLTSGANLNAQDKSGKTPIFYAINNGNFEIVKLLSTNGANLNNPELLRIAVQKELGEIVEVLLQHDTDVNASDEYGRTALHFTTSNEMNRFNIYKHPDIDIKGEIAKLLLSKGANVDAQTKEGLTTLHTAAQKGYLTVIEALLEYNANVNVNHKGRDSALHFAVRGGREEIVKVLLEYGAKVDAKTKEDVTPLLCIAARNDSQSIVEALLEFGADINSRDKNGRTALSIALREGKVNIVRTLLSYGSDINITCEVKHTPLDFAKALKTSFYETIDNMMYADSDDDFCYDPDRGICVYERISEELERHILKMILANIYVSQENLQSFQRSHYYNSDLKNKCKKEIANMKIEKVINTSISFYDILVKSTNSVEKYMRNENIVQVFKSDDYQTKFPIYANIIKTNVRKSIKRKDLLEQGNEIFHNHFPKLPHDCTEKICSYLSDEDLKILTNTFMSPSISSL